MATAIDFEDRNDWIGKPENQSNNQCYALPVCRIWTAIPGVIEKAPAQHTHAHVSCWQLTEEEIEEVKRTGKVYLKVQGTTTYPISIHGNKPIYLGEGELCDHVFTNDELDKLKGKSN